MLAIGRTMGDALLAAVRDQRPDVTDGLAIDEASLDPRPAARLLPDLMAWSRHFADQAVERLEAVTPGLLADLLPGTDLGPALRLVLTQRLGMTELPSFVRLLQAEGHRDAVMTNLPLARDQLDRLTAHLGVPPVADHVSTVGRDAASRFHKALRRGTLEAEATTRDHLARLPPDAALVLVGAAHEAPTTREIVGSLQRHLPVGVITKNARPGTIALAHEVSDHVVTSEELASLRPRKAILPATLSSLEGVTAILHAPSDPAMAAWVSELLGLVRLGLQWDRLVRDTNAVAVAGAMDRSAFGALTSHMEGGPITLDLQHGDTMPFAVGDLFAFDALVARSSDDLATYQQDGLTARITVAAGNPAWEQGSHHRDTPMTTASGDEKPLVMAFFPQPVKGPWISSDTMVQCYRALAASLDAIADLHVLVKVRADTPPDPWARELDRTWSRVTLLDDSALSAQDVLSACDVAMSVYSTALSDAIHAGVAAIAYDVHGVAPLANARRLGVVRLDTPEALVRAIERSRVDPPPAIDAAATGRFRQGVDDAVDRSLSGFHGRA